MSGKKKLRYINLLIISLIHTKNNDSALVVTSKRAEGRKEFARGKVRRKDEIAETKKKKRTSI